MPKTHTSNSTLMADKVFDDLFAFILHQGLKPGDRLTVDDLVRQFGVSQTPVRQALSRLQADGLVVNKPNSGFRVSDLPTRQHLLETLELRLMIETELAARAAIRCDEKTVLRLHHVLDTFHTDDIRDEKALLGLVNADAAFHRAIADCAGNSVAAETQERLHRRSTVFRLKFAPGMASEVVAEHKDIAGAIERKDPAAASQAMGAHLSASIVRVNQSSGIGERSNSSPLIPDN